MNPAKLLLEFLRKQHEQKLRGALKVSDFSILSQNCLGGGVISYVWYADDIPDCEYVH